MEKNMKIAIVGYIGTTLKGSTPSFLASQRPA